MHTGSRPKEWNATGDLGTNHSVPAHTKRGAKTSVGQAVKTLRGVAVAAE